MFHPPQEPWIRHPDAAEPNEGQKRKLSELVHGALLEIRALELDGKHEQARVVADLFHNVPILMWTPWFSLGQLQQQISSYQATFPTGGHIDFSQMLSGITSPNTEADSGLTPLT